ncbi:MAG: UDP-N-acetylenolpyruvoylglucosamine reductase, partial [Candidatus Marinimicrobia bacterium]|nr:UDP-N-acetylenolpyruvoylglucosamine reductase [Candidatus Neomarinimicrobiota bacterium]
IFLPKEKIEFSYRQSSILDIIVSAEFRFHESDSDEIRKSIAEISAKRKEQQPINFRSSGCIFKNPNEKSAGWLIDQAGLKGMQIGDAQISEKHANFFINTGASTAQDLYLLMRKVREIVYEKYKISLMPEVQLIGFEEAFDE